MSVRFDNQLTPRASKGASTPRRTRYDTRPTPVVDARWLRRIIQEGSAPSAGHASRSHYHSRPTPVPELGLRFDNASGSADKAAALSCLSVVYTIERTPEFPRGMLTGVSARPQSRGTLQTRGVVDEVPKARREQLADGTGRCQTSITAVWCPPTGRHKEAQTCEQTPRGLDTRSRPSGLSGAGGCKPAPPTEAVEATRNPGTSCLALRWLIGILGLFVGGVAAAVAADMLGLPSAFQAVFWQPYQSQLYLAACGVVLLLVAWLPAGPLVPASIGATLFAAPLAVTFVHGVTEWEQLEYVVTHMGPWAMGLHGAFTLLCLVIAGLGWANLVGALTGRTAAVDSW